MTEPAPKFTPPPNGSALLRENLFEERDDDNGELLKRREPTMLQRGKKLIAPPSDGTKRYTVVFDLDETVVYARDGPLYARAYLKDLFRSIKDDFEVIVWTAGERDYAKCILEEINEDNTIQHLVYRHEKWFKEEDYTKDLRQLGRDLNYTLMVENTPDCVRANTQNCIIVEDFEVLPETTEEENSMPPSLASTPPPPPGVDTAPSSSPSVAQAGADTSVKGDQVDTLRDGAPSAAPFGVTDGNPTALPRRRRRTDRTLFLLRELLQSLVRSGKTVPSFLASCELLSSQTVTGSDGKDISIYHLGTRRRRKDAGLQRKLVRPNRDKARAPAGESAAPTSSGPADGLESDPAQIGVKHDECTDESSPASPPSDAALSETENQTPPDTVSKANESDEKQ